MNETGDRKDVERTSMRKSRINIPIRPFVFPFASLYSHCRQLGAEGQMGGGV
jgi:hypothetical protein